MIRLHKIIEPLSHIWMQQSNNGSSDFMGNPVKDCVTSVTKNLTMGRAPKLSQITWRHLWTTPKFLFVFRLEKKSFFCARSFFFLLCLFHFFIFNHHLQISLQTCKQTIAYPWRVATWISELKVQISSWAPLNKTYRAIKTGFHNLF